MKTRITIHQMKKSVCRCWLDTLSEIARNNHGKLRLRNRRENEFLNVRLISLSRKELSFDISYDESDYSRLIRWSRSVTRDAEWYLTLTVPSHSDDGCYLDRFKVSSGIVSLVASRKSEHELPLSEFAS